MLVPGVNDAHLWQSREKFHSITRAQPCEVVKLALNAVIGCAGSSSCQRGGAAEGLKYEFVRPFWWQEGENEKT